MNGSNFNGMNISRLKQMMNTMKNPHMILSQMANTNPDLANVLQASNGDYKKAFYSMAERKGINPEDVLNQLKTFV